MNTAPAPTKKFTWDQFIDDVLSGAVDVSPLTRCACERHRRDLVAIGDPAFPYRFDAKRVMRAIDLFGSFPIIESDPCVPTPGQQFTLASMFGWVRKDDGRPRFDQGHFFFGDD
jgi:phage terminase large subunit-like protein